MPKSRENKKEFEALNWGNGRRIVYHFKLRRDSKTIQEIIEIYLKQNTLNQGPEVRNGYYVYPVRDPKQELYLRMETGHDGIFFYCAKDDSVPSPACQTRFSLNESTDIILSFHKSLLPKFSELKNDLTNLLQSFEVKRDG